MIDNENPIQANFARLLEEAPPTTCGACGTPMEAESVVVNVSVEFDWYDWRDPAALKSFVPAFTTFTDPTRYSGHVRYVCPTCGTSLLHKQAVTPGDMPGIFHFQPPSESRESHEGG